MLKKFNKSLSNTSNTSVESGIFDVDYNTEDEFESAPLTVAARVNKVLSDAKKESRIICGWKNTIEHLCETENPKHSLFFFIVPCANDDPTTHMRETFMRAFCYDHDIYVVQLDSVETFNVLLGRQKDEAFYQCALVQRSSALKCQHPDMGIDLDDFTKLEDSLIDYCEEVWYEKTQPITTLSP
jgi:hypothetical protein